MNKVDVLIVIFFIYAILMSILSLYFVINLIIMYFKEEYININDYQLKRRIIFKESVTINNGDVLELNFYYNENGDIDEILPRVISEKDNKYFVRTEQNFNERFTKVEKK